MKIRRIGATIAAWLALLAVPNTGYAQESFPNRPVRVVVPYAAGSVTDVFARIIAQNMAAQWNGSIIVESKSGANGSIAAEEVARAAPDGYTWLLVTTFFSATPALDPKLRWDPVRDFIAVGQVCRAPNFFIVPVTLPVKTVAEYVALAKAKPGTLNYSIQARDRPDISDSNFSSGSRESMSPRSAIAAIRRWCRISPAA